MASGSSRDLPAYFLGTWPSQFKHAILTPATRWRVFIEELQQVDHDVILNTVLRIRQAGERDASRIADRLQLPEELIRHLLATAEGERLDASNSGNGVFATRSRVGWVYRDAATGELWPEPGDQVEPLEIRYSGTFRGRFDVGTAGRRSSIDAVLLDTAERGDLPPTALDMARFSRSDAAQNRTALISSGERCLVVSPVSRDESGLAVLTTQGSPQLSLGRLLNSARLSYEPVVLWAKSVPLHEPEARKSSLAQVLDEMVDVLAHVRLGEYHDVSVSHVMSLIELSLGRFVDHYRHLHGLSAPDHRLSDDELTSVAERFGLDRGRIRRWADEPRSDARRKVVEILLARLHSDDALVRDASALAARYDSLTGVTGPSQEMMELAQMLVDAGSVLLAADRGGCE